MARPSDEVAIRACEGTNSVEAAFIDLVRSQDDEFVMPLLAKAVPSGIVTGAPFESMPNPLLLKSETAAMR